MISAQEAFPRLQELRVHFPLPKRELPVSPDSPQGCFS
jgi:hypothetical protein